MHKVADIVSEANPPLGFHNPIFVLASDDKRIDSHKFECRNKKDRNSFLCVTLRPFSLNPTLILGALPFVLDEVSSISSA